MLKQKGAMFGLDARIALAIFGALSVISGAALFSVIGEAQTRATYYEMQELGKAVEQYYLDVGHFPSIASNADVDFFIIDNLIQNTDGVAGWRGPYIGFEIGSSSYLERSEYDFYIFLLNDKATWGGATRPNRADTGKCLSGQDCFAWIRIDGGSDKLFTLIDEQVDGGDGEETGKVRTYRPGTSLSSIYVQYHMSVENPND
jgi:type II secretory pathway pseudopilin PulG